jgi:hypothetical protein
MNFLRRLLTLPADGLRALGDRRRNPWARRSWRDFFRAARAKRRAAPDKEKPPRRRINRPDEPDNRNGAGALLT